MPDGRFIQTGSLDMADETNVRRRDHELSAWMLSRAAVYEPVITCGANVLVKNTDYTLDATSWAWQRGGFVHCSGSVTFLRGVAAGTILVTSPVPVIATPSVYVAIGHGQGRLLQGANVFLNTAHFTLAGPADPRIGFFYGSPVVAATPAVFNVGAAAIAASHLLGWSITYLGDPGVFT